MYYLNGHYYIDRCFYYYPDFIHAEIEAQRGKITCPII